MRNLRNSIVEVLEAEYVDFARAKGLKARVVLGSHVLRNAVISTGDPVRPQHRHAASAAL